ncbi:MAG TPA: hypothetical protein VGF17_05075 [Phytomonospora sp.]
MAIENPDLVEAYHQVSGEKSEVPEHWLGKDSPFPGQWGKTAPSASDKRAAEKAIASTEKEK